jgi:hypothetical protein
VVAVNMSYQDSLEILNLEAAVLEGHFHICRTEPAINEECGFSTPYQCGVPGAGAAEDTDREMVVRIRWHSQPNWCLSQSSCVERLIDKTFTGGLICEKLGIVSWINNRLTRCKVMMQGDERLYQRLRFLPESAP